MTPIPVDMSKLGPFGRWWVEKEMPFDPIYNSLESLREHERRAGGQVQAIEHIPDHMFPNAARRFGLIPWHPKTDEDYALLKRSASTSTTTTTITNMTTVTTTITTTIPNPVTLLRVVFCFDAPGTYAQITPAVAAKITGSSSRWTSMTRAVIRSKTPAKIKKQLAEAKRYVTKQKTRLALKEAAVVALEKELAEAEERAGSM